MAPAALARFSVSRPQGYPKAKSVGVRVRSTRMRAQVRAVLRGPRPDRGRNKEGA